MEIKYPFVIIITLLLILIIFVVKKRPKPGKGRKIANTSLVRGSAVYRQILRRYRTLTFIIFALIVLATTSVAVLTARLITVDTVDQRVYNRDIIICMDVSGSMDTQNSAIIHAYQKLVDAMRGERFGISIFDSSSYLLMPLTDDYEYITETLSALDAAYNANESLSELYSRDDFDFDSDEYLNYIKVASYLTDGTGAGEGSSKAGDGLATCVYDFPNLDEERSRAIILSTDNEVYGEQIVDVVDAAKIAKKKDITIYALSPSFADAEMRKELKQAAELSGGKLYLQNEAYEVDGIVSNIETTERSLLNKTPQITEKDHPSALFFVALISVAVAMLLGVIL